jgi:hypothetical protein
MLEPRACAWAELCGGATALPLAVKGVIMHETLRHTAIL